MKRICGGRVTCKTVERIRGRGGRNRERKACKKEREEKQ